MDLTDQDIEHIADQVKQGFTTGQFSVEDDDGKTRRVNWTLTVEKWED